ncbi:MAG: hypothetical protein V4549_15920 [Bacteroidota bacterium]
MKQVIITISILLYGEYLYAQGCCSGGSGSPIAGGASQGVLQERQMEISSNYQYIGTSKFLYQDKDTVKQFDYLSSNYIYTRLAYGLTKDFTMSVESGYFINKTQIGLDKVDTIKSSGIADLILFPRYDIVNRTEESKRTEITIGLGYKIPLGMHNDSTVVYTNPTTGQRFYTTSPPTVQPTTGSQDIIFYTFFFRGYPLKNFRIFANTLYIKKGWNSLGQKFGDYATIGLFASKTFFEKLGVTLQVRGEWIDKMKADKNVDLLALYNVDITSTGSRKVFFVPQLSYTHKSFTVFVLSEIPVYQYVNNIQVASQYQFTGGLSYRFYINKP